ncbi:S8 family serine peptidase [Stieleria sp. ICT_E10.1]|uniref:S8 family serine peptidase n=1 Tax=Stieleria sedimenti TaxID=2976331 RepID=UPI0021805CD1|nr:S8 family serine peptidase [Stieleria sedimenti]MCS7470454.1 S8 family serine peptidase [Stieleria sedimenti]
MHLEQLESRYLLAGDFGGTADQPPPESPAPISWFESFENVPRLELESLAAVDAVYPDGFQGPRELAAGEWILQLTDSVAGRVHVLQTADRHLDGDTIDFTIIAGLGAEGLVLVRGEGVTQADIETSLLNNKSVASFTLNSVITGQSTVPNDADYTAGLLDGLQAIDAEAAWNSSRGDLNTVVGVVDSGIDLNHPDLYLNIWVNQGEIPSSFKRDLVDIDNDGLITFYDLNNVTIGPAPQYALSSADYAAGPNANWLKDLNHDGLISAVDLLNDPKWSDGRDTDSNGFFDDLFGVNFRNGAEEVFAPNEPIDALGHGTHVAGTIGAIGSNNLGVVGVNWQTSLMSLRILDNNNRSDAGAGLRAVNYARMMRQRHEVDAAGRTSEGANVRVLNNSWGQPGGYEPAFESAIGELGASGVLFVAAAGNGDIFGNGVNNDTTPFYPASYEAANVLSVAASTVSQELATFSNFGTSSVDLAAPGTGIRSSVSGGGYGSANGTSMAAPHVSGTAALLWSALPNATVEEVKSAIVGSVDPMVGGDALLTSGGTLNASAAIDADVFGPAARLVTKPDIANSGGTSTEFTVEYLHRSGIDTSSVGDDDLLVRRSWGPQAPIPAKLKPGSIVPLDGGNGIAATYVIDAPGGGDFDNPVNVPIGDASPRTITSQIMVSDVSQLIADLTLTLDIQHSDISALTVKLIAPSGQEAILFSGVGNAGGDLAQVTLDDRAAILITATTPLAGQFYRPVESLLALGAKGPNGVWTLEIEDVSSASSGSLNGWSLDFNGSWDAVDYGSYTVSTVADSVAPLIGVQSINALDIGTFQVRVEDDPTVFYVEQPSDILGISSLRDAIVAANHAAPEPRTIIVDAGHYSLQIPPELDSTSPFADPDVVEVCRYDDRAVWSDAASGDLDISGSITIIGANVGSTVVDGAGIDRVFKVHPGAELRLERLTVSGGVSPPFQGGGGILSSGQLELHDTEVRDNTASEVGLNNYQHGGGVAVWGGEATVYRSWIHDNESNYGAGIYFCGDGTGVISHSTLSENDGGGLHSHSDGDVNVSNSTFSGNRGGVGAIFNGKLNGDLYPNGNSFSPSISGDGRYVAFASFASNLLPGDSNDESDVYLRDRVDGTLRRISVSDDGLASGGWDPRVSADGRFVVFSSDQPLMAGNALTSLYVYDIENRQLARIRPAIGGTDGNGDTLNGSLSADGRFVVFQSGATDLVFNDTNGKDDIFVYDRVNQTTERISVSDSGGQTNDDSSEPTISNDGRYVAFESDADNLVASDTNGNSTDVFVRDRIAGTTELVSLHFNGSQLRYSVGDPEISGDGKFITFTGRLLSGLPNSIFLYDREAGTSELISANQNPDADDAYQPTISDDGRYVAFLNFRVSSGYIYEDIYLYDSETESLEQVNGSDDGLPPGTDIFRPALSADGGSVAVVTEGVFEPPEYSRHVYVFDLPDALSPIFDEVESLVTVSQTTVANTEQAANSVQGNVHLVDTLVSSDAAGIGSTVSLDNVVPQTGLIGPLQQESGGPPIHRLLFGNPAMNAGSEQYIGDVDQLGTPRVVPDIGAQESVAGMVSTRVFIDRNADQRIGPGEAGVPEIEVIARGSGGQVFRTSSVIDDPTTTTVNEAGLAEFASLPADEYGFEVIAPPGWTLSQPTIQRVQASGGFGRTALSKDGRFLAYSSFLPSLVPNDTNDASDVFVKDLSSGLVERVSVNSDATEGNSHSYEPSMSADGRFVLFASHATNLVPDDANGTYDLFVHDRIDGTTERVNIGSDGAEANAGVFQRLISEDGRYVFFDTTASNLVPNDTNNVYDVFVFDRQMGTSQRLSLNANGSQRTFDSTLKAISPDGRFIAYGYNTGSGGDAYILDRDTGSFETVSFGNGFGYSALSADGRFYVYESSDRLRIWDRQTGASEQFPTNLQGNPAFAVNEPAPAISDNGRFVVFPAEDSNLVPDDNNGTADIFVYDRQEDRVARVSVDVDGNEANGTSSDPTITGDGLFIAFSSGASNLTSGDGNGAHDRFVTLNPFVPYVISRTVQPGSTTNDFGIGLIPDTGVISGRVFEDVIQNQTADPNEPGLSQWTVFLDTNGNQLLDAGERFVETGSDGSYAFTDVAGYQQYQVRVLSHSGWEHVTPGPADDYQWDIFLPAAGAISGRDFGVRRIISTGQSTHSVAAGRVYEDLNNNQQFDEGVDMPVSDIPIFLDANNDGQHTAGTDEPIEVTQLDGTFEFTGQATRIVTVRAQLDEASVLANPVGNDFAAATYDLFTGPTSFRTPSSATHADFDQDGDEDLAVLLSDGNQLSIRLNGGDGSFHPVDIDISLGQTATLPGTSLPLEMIVGQFNDDSAGRFDVAIVGQASNNVLVLLDYEHSSKDFLDRRSVSVGNNPVSLTSGDFDKNGTVDLAVLNFGFSVLAQESPLVFAKSAEDFQLLLNDGAGNFAAQTAVPVAGDDPIAILSEDFNDDGNLDLVVLHLSPTLPNTPFGDVALYSGNGGGGFSLSGRSLVEGGPLEMVTGDFNGDAIPDLAVANVLQNTLSILTSNGDGTLKNETEYPVGSGTLGVDSMGVADIDRDGDLDIIATRLQDGRITVFRNITDTSAGPVHVRFEPLESFGTGQFSVFERAPIVLANFDNDVSGPNGEGTIDIVAIPKSTATINVLLNRLVDGGHRIALDGLNSISGLDFIVTPTGDVVPPLVTDVRIAASGWTTSFRSAVDPQNLRGVELPGPTALRPLSWNGLDTLFIEFSEDIQKTTGGSIDAADLTLAGANVPDYETAPEFGITTSYTNGGGDGPFLLTIQLAGAVDFGADRIALGIGDSIVDLAGNPLGGNSIFGFNVLPGDVDGSGGVLATDVLTINASQFTFAGAAGYDAFRDIDGSGAVFANDVLLTNSRQFTFLPPEPSPPAEGEAPVSLMVEAEGEDAGAAGVKLFGEIETFNGPGTYTLDMYVEAVGGPVSIAGFNAPLLVDGTGVSFAGDDTAFAPNASFDLEFVTGLGTPGVYGVAGSLGPGLQLDAGQSEILFSIDLVVDSNFDTAADVVSIITEGPFASALQFTDADLATIQDVTIESAARITVPVPPVVLLNSLATDPADLPQGAQPSSWDIQRDQIRDIVIELQTPIAALPAGGITLTNLGANDGDPETVIELRVDQVSLDANGIAITILLDANQLPDGRYKLELSPEVTSGSAFAFIADDQNRFFVLRGDWDGNSSVDLRDLETFAYWSGIPGGVPDYVNDDGIGGITIDDLAGFEANYAVKLDVPGMTESIDPAWIDAEAFERAKATIIERTDVNGSGMASPLDALNVINRIATQFVGTTDWQYDVNRDAEITPRDALFVINAIARASLSDLKPGEASPTEPIALRSSTTVAAAEAPTESLSDAPTVILDLVGGRQTYSGPGTYTFDFTITAIGGDQTIAGFNLPLRFDVPGVTFGGTIDDFVRNPAFSYEYVAPLSQANHFGVAASSSSGLALAQGQTAVLFSIVVDVSASVDVASELEIAVPITEGPDAQGIQFIGTGIEVIDPPNFVRGAVLAPPGPGIQLTGAVQEFNGAGTYTLDFMAEALGGPVSIAGFNAPLMIDVPGVTFAGDASAFHPNASFQNGNEYVTAFALPNAYGVAASLGDVLQLAEGERVVLFSIDVAVDPSAGIGAAAEVAKIITSGTLASSLQLIDPDAEPILDVFVGANAILARAIDPVVMINDGSSTRSQITSLVVTFDALVDHTDLATAFRLTNLDSGLAVGTIQIAAVDQGTQTIATLTFDGVSTIARQGTGSLGNSLADGNYRLDIFAQQVQSSNGQQLFRDEQFGDNATDLLFRFFGDTDGDRDVDGQDYGRFGLGFLKSFDDPGYDAPLDSDGDGDIDGQDYGRFGLNFLKSM